MSFIFQIIKAAIVVGLFGAISYKIAIVDLTGLIAGFIIGFTVYASGGEFLFIPLLVFHLVSGIFTKYKYEYKRKKGVAEEKKGARGWRNVSANGAIPAIFSLLAVFNSNPFKVFCIAGFFGAVVTALADTLATEIGLLYKGEPRLITNLRKKVPAGTSGGVSILGETAQIMSALFISITATIFYPKIDFLINILILTIISGFLGSSFDSFLGATIQAMYKCQYCGKETEKKVHCNKETLYLRGYKWLDNNVVNLFAIALGSLVAILLLYFKVISLPI
ncbi:MAG: DUF92 domain-containing protein [Nitrososphaerota archaeon]